MLNEVEKRILRNMVACDGINPILDYLKEVCLIQAEACLYDSYSGHEIMDQSVRDDAPKWMKMAQRIEKVEREYFD